MVINGFGDPDAIEIEREGIEDLGVRCVYDGADMTKPDEITAMVENTVKKFGSVDVVVNNAGIQNVQPVEEFPPDKWDQIVAINMSSAFHTVRAALPHMKARGWGRIINIASAHGLVASPFKSAYVTAKHGMLGFTKTVALETAENGITCNAICPAADTRMTVNDAVIANRKRRLENGLMTQEQYDRASRPRGPEHIAPMVAYLCTPQSQDINGHVFHVERGRIHNYYYGEELKALHKGGDGMFSVDELIEDIPATIMSEVARVK